MANEDEMVVTLSVTVTLPGGKKLPHESVTNRIPVLDGYSDDVVRTLSSDLSSIVDNMARRGVKPCTFKLNAKGKTKLASEGLTWEGSYEGEGQFSLTEDGSFSGDLPIQYSWSPIVLAVGAGTATCSMSAGNQDTMNVAGEFDDNDGALRFNRMQTNGMSGTITSTCTVAGQSITQSIPAPTSGGGCGRSSGYSHRPSGPRADNGRVSIV